ncbi:MAG: sodium-dependent transporter [Bacteroidales bacterium]
MNKKNKNRDNFGSQFGILVALTGSAVGLGNLWRFPYLLGTSGGAAFLIVYVIFILLLGIPLMCSEFVIGRRTHKNAFGAFKKLAPGSHWGIVGIFGVLAAVAIISFYSVVGGWSINYLVKSLSFNLCDIPISNLTSTFNISTHRTWMPLFYLFIFLSLSGGILLGGVNKGIEKYSKVMMPILFLLVIILVIRSVTLKGAGAGLVFLFKPDFSVLSPKVIINAMGQAFFSLSIGMGAIITYASYVKKEENIMQTISLTAIFDTLFALLAGMAIMPAVFAFGIEPGEGPGLVFITLPQVFAKIPGGSIMAILFFFILLVAAVTSSISVLEVIVAYMAEEFKIKRKTAVIISVVIAFVFGILCSLSLGILGPLKVFGMNIFDLFNYISANILMTVGALLIAIFVGYRLKKKVFVEEMTNNGLLKKSKGLAIFIFYLIKYVVPIFIIVIMIGSFICD